MIYGFIYVIFHDVCQLSSSLSPGGYINWRPNIILLNSEQNCWKHTLQVRTQVNKALKKSLVIFGHFKVALYRNWSFMSFGAPHSF